MGKLTVYLAGPMTGHSSSFSTGWRNEFKTKYKDRIIAKDPLDRIPTYENKEGKDRYATITDGERRDILNCHGLIAYMNDISMGTAMGIMYAFLSGRTVVIVCPNTETTVSPMVKHHSHMVCSTIEEAVLFLEKRHGRKKIKGIIDRSGKTKPWNPDKIKNAIKQAIRATYENEDGELSPKAPNSDKLSSTVIMQLEDSILAKPNEEYLGIEIIQNMVEKVLMDNAHRKEVHSLAKEYIIYRRKREELRDRKLSDDETLTFINNILHDIKSPIGNIGRLCEDMKEALLNNNLDEAKELLDLIEKNNAKSEQHVLSYKNKADTRFKSESIDLRSFVAEEFRGLKHQLVTYHNYIQNNITLIMHKHTLSSIITNLVNNSILHGFNNGSGNIYVKTSYLEGDEVLFEYWNDGARITQTKAKHIFSGKKNKTSGSNNFQVGLSQVKKTIEDLGGRVECIAVKEKSDTTETSLKGEDTSGIPVFKICLRIKKELTTSSKKVLVADDVDTDRLMMKRVFKKTDLEVILATSIDEACTLLQNHEFYAAVLDVDFQEDKDGLWLLKQISKSYPHIKVIIVSGRDSATVIRKDWKSEAMSLGAIECFDKSIYTAKQIIKAIQF